MAGPTTRKHDVLRVLLSAEAYNNITVISCITGPSDLHVPMWTSLEAVFTSPRGTLQCNTGVAQKGGVS